MGRLTLRVLLALLVLLAGCDRAPDLPPPQARSTPPLRLAVDRWPGYYPAVLAEELGYFADAGVDVQLEFPENTDHMLAEFAAGGFDMVGVALGDLITLTRSRPDVGVLLVSDVSAGGDALLVRSGFGLDGVHSVRIGTNLGGFGELFVRELLPRLQLDPQRIEWINIDASDVPEALVRGEIDLGHCWEPYVRHAEQAGASRVASSLDTPGLIPDVVAATRHAAEHRGEALRAFNVAWFRAVAYWKANPLDAQRRIEHRLALAPGAAALDGIALQDAGENRLLFGADGDEAGLVAVIDRYSRFFVAHGRLLEPVQASEMLLPVSPPEAP